MNTVYTRNLDYNIAKVNIIERGLNAQIEHPGRLGRLKNSSTIFTNELFLAIKQSTVIY